VSEILISLWDQNPVETLALCCSVPLAGRCRGQLNFRCADHDFPSASSSPHSNSLRGTSVMRLGMLPRSRRAVAACGPWRNNDSSPSRRTGLNIVLKSTSCHLCPLVRSILLASLSLQIYNHGFNRSEMGRERSKTRQDCQLFWRQELVF
jgi:hypothetical protein